MLDWEKESTKYTQVNPTGFSSDKFLESGSENKGSLKLAKRNKEKLDLSQNRRVNVDDKRIINGMTDWISLGHGSVTFGFNRLVRRRKR